jgi:hypothetical protein
MTSRANLAFLFVLGLTFVIQACGSFRPPVVSTPAPATSAIACPSGNVPCSGSLDVPLTLVDGTDPATFGIPITCSLTAGTQAMNFTMVPSMPWFGVSPGSGTLAAGGSTTIAVSSINAAGVNARNVGAVTVSAPGYKDNSQMAVELNCNAAAGNCKIAFSCEPKKFPLP